MADETKTDRPTAKPNAGTSVGGKGAAADAAGTNTAVPAATHGEHDRVAMLSLRADGTPDQLAPEFLGPKGDAVTATTEQFRQQAVSATDVVERGVASGPGTVTLIGQEDGSVKEVPATSDPDPATAELKAKHDEAADAATSAAERAVEKLHQGLGA